MSDSDQALHLMPLVRGYMEAAGFKILNEQKECIVADRLAFGQDRDTRIIWTVPLDQEIPRYESSLRASISAVRPAYPDARAHVVAKSRAGVSRDLQRTLTEQRISLVVPVQFFDTEFKRDEAPQAHFAIADFRSLEILDQRVAQPYKSDSVTGKQDEGLDLLATLLDELKKLTSPTVRLVVGRAGIGKTFLFRALFAQLYEDFRNAKSRLALKPRPIPLLSEHLKGTYALRTELLIENFLHTDVASPVPRAAFEWLFVNGFSIWVFDGLDELYAGDPYFFDYVTELLTRPGSKAQVMIFCRDSLLTTSDPFVDFQNQCSGGTFLRTYRLSDWDRPSKRSFAWLRLEDRTPPDDDDDTAPVLAFLGAVEKSRTLRSLSGLPFYCEILVQQFRDGSLQEFGDDVVMLNHAIDQLIKREIEKGLLDLRVFEPGGLDSWMEQIGCDFIEAGRITRDDAEAYGSMVLNQGVDAQTQKNVIISLLRFPLFAAGSESGLVFFAHDLIAEVLAARRYVRSLRRYPADVARRISRTDLEDPNLLRFMASRLTDEDTAAVLQALQRGDLQGRDYAVLLALFMLARPERDLLKKHGLPLEGRDLVSIRFDGRDLMGQSVRRSDLSRALFRNCDLREAALEGAFLSRTRFEGENQLQGAEFGDLSRVQSVIVNGKLLDDVAQLRKWVAQQTGRPQEAAEPCPAALQLLHLFGKFVTPLGLPRRDDLKRDGLLAGRRYPAAASIERCIQESVQNGYLTGPDFRNRYRRATGDRYQQIVEFVRDSTVSDGLKRVLACLCRADGCTHQLQHRRGPGGGDA